MVAAVTLLGVTLAEDPVELKRVPAVGTTMRYRETSKFTPEDSDRTIDVSVIKKVRVVSVEKEKFVEETVVLPNDDDQVPVEGFTSTRVFQIDGMLIEEKKSDAGDYAARRGANMALILLPTTPVSKGDKWERSFKGFGSDTFVTKCTYTFTGVEEQEGVRCAVIEFSQTESETDCSCKGKAWLDLSDGSLVRKEYKIKKVPAGAGRSMSGETVIRRLK
jgi:hypothetical protein